MSATKELTPKRHVKIGADTQAGRDRGLTESAARLDKLPEGLEFPPRLLQRIAFDPRRQRLVFYGFMTKRDYDCLRGLSSDAAYQQALDQLFRESSAHSIAVEIGIDQVLGDNLPRDSTHPVASAIWRWVLQWVLMIVCLAGGAVLVWWWLSGLC